MPRIFARLLTAALIFGLTGSSSASAQLSIVYGSTGLQKLSYGETVLEDTAQFGADLFHIWHMKVTDLQGNVLAANGWGENAVSKSWDAVTHTWTYQYAWGSIRCQFAQAGDMLNVVVAETNLANSGVVLDGATIYPLALHFPSLPSGFVNVAYPQLSFNTTAPSALLANYGAAEVAAVMGDAAKPLYSGFWPLGDGTAAYNLLISGTTPDGLATFQPHNDRPVQPGQTDIFTVSLRFAPAGTPLKSLAMDAYTSWGTTWPAQLQWNDRRIIGTSYLATSPQGGDIHQSRGFSNNPRRYFNSSDPDDFDVRNAAGMAKFQAKVLQRAKDIVTNLQRLNAQGVITWDIEGEEYAQDTSYVCSPDQVAMEAPEMESVITNGSTGFAGQKLDDAYFQIIRNAGFRVGVCVRPQHFTKAGDESAQQIYLANTDVEAEMRKKIQYAHDRWGATLFYIDSSVEGDGAVLDAAIFQRLAANFSDSLLIPEESTPKHYAYTAPFQTFIYHGDTGTNSDVYGYYPKAFSVNLINDADPSLLAAAVPKLTAAVAAGDILMAHADYWQQNNPAIMAIYQAAGATAPSSPTTPAPPAPATGSRVMIQSPASLSTVSGTIQVAASIAATLDAAGSFLMVDGARVNGTYAALPPYTYTLDTTMFTAGNHMLQIWAHDTANEVLLSDPVTVEVASASATTGTGSDPTPTPPNPTPANPLPAGPIAITYPTSGQALTGMLTVAANIALQLDAAGSFLLVDGQQYSFERTTSQPYLYLLDCATLSAGKHLLQIWAHTTGNATVISDPVAVSVGP